MPAPAVPAFGLRQMANVGTQLCQLALIEVMGGSLNNQLGAKQLGMATVAVHGWLARCTRAPMVDKHQASPLSARRANSTSASRSPARWCKGAVPLERSALCTTSCGPPAAWAPVAWTGCTL